MRKARHFTVEEQVRRAKKLLGPKADVSAIRAAIASVDLVKRFEIVELLADWVQTFHHLVGLHAALLDPEKEWLDKKARAQLLRFTTRTLKRCPTNMRAPLQMLKHDLERYDELEPLLADMRAPKAKNRVLH